MVGSRSGESSRLCGRQLKRPSDRRCWAGNEVPLVADGWWNADAAECQHRRPRHGSLTDTVECGRSDTGELSLPAWRTLNQGRQASEACRAISDPGRGQTSECRWWRARRQQQTDVYLLTNWVRFHVTVDASMLISETGTSTDVRFHNSAGDNTYS